MKNILVPVDFSKNAERALSAARIIAKGIDAHLYILHAHQPYMAEVTLGRGTLPGFDDLQASFKKDLDRYVEELIADGFSADGIWQEGAVDQVVKTQANELKPEMIVIGRTGKGGFVDKLFGTAASDIVKVSPVPVLVIPPQAHPENFKEIVYATQLEYEERHVIGRVLRLSQVLGGRVTFLKVNSLTQPDIQEDKQFIDEIISEFDLPEDDFIIKEAGSVIGGIEKYAEELEADLLVVATRSRGILEKLFIDPSVTSRMIVKTSMPLLVFHLDQK